MPMFPYQTRGLAHHGHLVTLRMPSASVQGNGVTTRLPEHVHDLGRAGHAANAADTSFNCVLCLS